MGTLTTVNVPASQLHKMQPKPVGTMSVALRCDGFLVFARAGVDKLGPCFDMLEAAVVSVSSRTSTGHGAPGAKQASKPHTASGGCVNIQWGEVAVKAVVNGKGVGGTLDAARLVAMRAAGTLVMPLTETACASPAREQPTGESTSKPAEAVTPVVDMPKPGAGVPTRTAEDAFREQSCLCEERTWFM